MAKAEWNDVVIAQADHFEVVENNIYFAQAAVDASYLEPSTTHTICGWKGTASYYHVVVNGKRLEDAAWFYPDPKPAAAKIKDHIAFWRGVKIER